MGTLNFFFFTKEAPVDVNKNNKDETSILLAAEQGNKDIVEDLLDAAADINVRSSNEWTLLHYTSYNGWLNIAQHLTTRGVALDPENDAGDTPILLAAEKSHKDIVKLLLEAAADVNVRSSNKWTLLHYASYNGWLEIAQHLTTRGVALDPKNDAGNTPILLAAEKSHKDIVKHLIDAGANTGFCSYIKWTLLHHAAEKGWFDVTLSLLQKGSNLNAKNIARDVPLTLAARNSHKDIVELLISFGANLDCYNKDKVTVLHLAARNGWPEVVQSLVQKGCDPNATTSRGCTPLFYAVYERHKNVFELLIDLGTKVNCCDDKGWTVLHHVSTDGWINVVELLVQKGADLNAKSSNGKTPLLLAAESSHEDLVDMLINLDADINSFDEKKWSVLHFAAKSGWLDVVQSLVSKGADPGFKTSYIYTPLLPFVDFEWREYYELRDRANLHWCSKKKESSLRNYRVFNKPEEFLVLSRTNFHVKNCQTLTPLLLAAQFSRHKGIIRLLIDSGTDLDCRGESNRTILHYASRYGWTTIAQSIIEKGADLNVQTNDGQTALIIAAKYQYIDIVKLLINAGANIKCSDVTGFTLACYAIHNAWMDIVQYLIKKGVEFNEMTTFSGMQVAPILFAAENSWKDFVQVFLEIGVNIDCCDDRKWTILHYASLYKWLDVARSVVERGSDVNAKISSGDTTIHLACRFTDMIITEPLIDNCIEVIKLLAKKGADINAQNYYSETPLVFACHYLLESENEFLLLKFLNYLFRLGADCNTKNIYGKTLFLKIIKTCNINIIKLFIENGAYFNNEDYNSMTAIIPVKDVILQDVKLCSQAIINKFNNKDLTTLYKLPIPPGTLPPIEEMKICDTRGTIQDVEQVQAIEKTVKWAIQTNGYCDVLKVSPILLSILSVKSVIDLYAA